MSFFNRITGKQLPELPPGWDVSLGAYLVKGDNYRLNYLPVDKTCYLIPNECGDVRVDSLENYWQGRFDCPLLDQEQVLASLREISEEVEIAESLDDYIAISPLINDIEGRLALTEFEQQLVDDLFHLEHIVRFPDARLDRVEEKQPVSRVSRFSNRALNQLSAHSEDWLRRKYQSVIPRQVLALRIDEDIDIYENRVTARLIRELITYLCKRIDEELKQLEDFFEEISKILNQYNHANRPIWYRKVNRNYKLIGDVFSTGMESRQKQTRNTRDTLFAARQRLLVLLGLPFFQQVQRHAELGRSLHLTNRFQNHAHYRSVVTLWEALAKLQQIETASDRQKRYIETLECFERYGFVLIMRSLNLLNFKEDERPVTWPLSKWVFSHPALGKLTISWDALLHRFTLKGNGETFYILPWPDSNLPAQIEKSKEITYLLYYYSSPKPERLTIGSPTSLGYIPVSLFVPDSIERVARAIFWELAVPYFSSAQFKNEETCICICCGKLIRHDHSPNSSEATGRCESCEIKFGVRRGHPFLEVDSLSKMAPLIKDLDPVIQDAWIDSELGKDILSPFKLKKEKIEWGRS